MAGGEIGKNSANTKGEATFSLTPAQLNNSTIRVVAEATDYEEKWSDITPSFLNTDEQQKYYTVYLKKKTGSVVSGEKKYGPYTITAAGWQSTGLYIKKGGSFRVEATGNIRHKDDTRPNGGHDPDGKGAENYWNWWVMSSKIGNERVREVGSKGSGGTTAGGILELGVPRAGADFIEADRSRVGSFTVYVYSKDVIEETNNVAPPPIKKNEKSINWTDEQIAKAMIQIDFLKRMASFKEQDRTLNDQYIEVRKIAQEYSFNFDACRENLGLSDETCFQILFEKIEKLRKEAIINRK